VLAARGFGGLTLRAVAMSLGASTGLLTHYFANKRALVRYAHEVAEERTENRPRRRAESPGLAALRAALVDVLPLTPESVAMSRVWVSFWDAALDDPELTASQRTRYVRWRERLQTSIEAAQARGELPASASAPDMAIRAAAFAHGLVVQSLFDPNRLPPPRQTQLLDDFLTNLSQG